MRNFTSNSRTLFTLLLITVTFILLPLVTSAMLQARVITVEAGGDLQAALNVAQPGDIIVLQANADYACSCILPVKSGSSHITIRSSRADEISGRVNPATQSALLARVRSGHPSEPAFATVPGAHHYTFIGLDIAPKSDGQAFHAIRFGDSGTNQQTLAQVPHDLIVDRSFVHGAPTQDIQRGITLNSASTTVINSHVSDIHYVGVESQAVGGWNGPGPFKIDNNYLEAAGINVLFGGALPSINGLVPSDIEITNNDLFKPLSWMVGHPSYAGIPWNVKNPLELKSARRVRIEGNRAENSWKMGQVGMGLNLNASTEDSGSWNVIEDVVIRRNQFLKMANGIVIAGGNKLSTDSTAVKLKRVTIEDNVIDSGHWGGEGRAVQIAQGSEDLTLNHNTLTGRNTFTLLDAFPDAGVVHLRLKLLNNLGNHGTYGVFGNGGYFGTAALNRYASIWQFQKNAIYGDMSQGVPPDRYPPDNYFVATLTEAQPLLGTDGLPVGVRSNMPSPSPTPSPSATATPPASPTPTPSSTPSPTPTATPSPTPTPDPTPFPCTMDVPASISVRPYDRGEIGVSLNSMVPQIARFTVTATSNNAGQVFVFPPDKDVLGTSAVISFGVTVKKRNGIITFESPCGIRRTVVMVQ